LRATVLLIARLSPGLESHNRHIQKPAAGLLEVCFDPHSCAAREGQPMPRGER